MPTPRPGSTQRGYGYRHKQLRERAKRDVQRGTAICWRCNKPIPPNADFDLGHDDHDRTLYRGPEHQACNRATKTHHAIAHAGPDMADTSRLW